MDSPKIKRAIISVSDKTDLDVFAKGLAEMGVEIYSTGGTRTFLEANGIPCKDISAYTGFPEMMDGRLKTLHPYVFGGILCRHDREDDMAGLQEHGILTFELVCVNLYPFEATIAKPDVTAAQAIEKIDIGGPSLVRAAAKNHLFTSIVTSKDQFQAVLDSMKENGGATTFELRRQLAADAFNHTAKYDRAIANWFSKEVGEGDFPQTLGISFERSATLRYGELLLPTSNVICSFPSVAALPTVILPVPNSLSSLLCTSAMNSSAFSNLPRVMDLLTPL